jgi:hypothetical protein
MITGMSDHIVRFQLESDAEVVRMAEGRGRDSESLLKVNVPAIPGRSVQGILLLPPASQTKEMFMGAEVLRVPCARSDARSRMAVQARWLQSEKAER